MRMMVRAAIVLLLLALMPSAAQAEKRIALLIGNQSYTSEIGRLSNPHNDIALLEQALKVLGFDVAVERDASLGALTRAVNAYARRVRGAGPNAVGFFYYSGHGAADAGINYLIPVDVKSAEDTELWDQSLRLTEVTRKLKAEAGNATHFVVFDACRNNLKLRTTGSRSLVQSKGFVPVTQESGMLIAYATAEGELASDVGAGAGPYAKALAEEIVKPGVEAVYMFRRVQVRVRTAIGQEPWLGFSALGEVHFAGVQAEAPKPPAVPSPSPVRPSEAAEAWDRTKDTTNVAALEAFVRRFGDTYYGDLAKVRLADLKHAEAAKQAADAEKKKAAEAEAERQRLAAARIEEDRLRRERDSRAEEEAASQHKPRDTIFMSSSTQCTAYCNSQRWCRDTRFFDGRCRLFDTLLPTKQSESRTPETGTSGSLPQPTTVLFSPSANACAEFCRGEASCRSWTFSDSKCSTFAVVADGARKR
jgi:uncharacterized caspase-like protein